MDFGFDNDVSRYQLQKMYPLLEDGAGGEGYACGEQGYMENLCTFLQFCCESKVALKVIKSFLKKIKRKLSVSFILIFKSSWHNVLAYFLSPSEADPPPSLHMPLGTCPQIL